MTTLHDFLWNLTTDDLRYRLKFLDPGLKATRKADLIDGIKAALSGPGLVAALDALDETGRLAVMEAVHESSHRHLPTRFNAKYGRDAEFHLMPEKAPGYSSWQSTGNATRLNVFFGCPWNPVVFPSSDGEVEFAKEEQDPDAKGGERPQPPRIRDDPGNQ